MRYQVIDAFKVKISQGEMELQPGQVITLPHDLAIRLLNEGRIKVFCYWLNNAVDDCQGTCSEGVGMKTNKECPHFKTYLKERLLKQLPSETREKTNSREVMSQKYNELAEWLHSHDLTSDEIKETLPGLYLDIQDVIERLDNAFIVEDLTGFQDALDRIKLLYTEALLKCGRNVAIKVYSELLGCHLWVVNTDQDMHTLRSQGIKEAIYTAGEIKKLKSMSKNDLKAVHEVKRVFENSKIEEVTKHNENL